MPEPTFSTSEVLYTCGIYVITGPGAKPYIGSSDDIPRRWRDHKALLRRGSHHNWPLQAAWVAYGENAFTFTVVEEIAAVADLIDAEQRHLDAAVAAGPVYNVAMDVRHPYRGLVHTPEARRKMSAAAKASMTPENLQGKSARVAGSLNPGSKLDEGKVREICALLLMGTHPAELARDLKLSEGLIYQIRGGKIWRHIVTPEMAAAMKEVRQNPWVSGKRTVTDEHRQRFSEVGRARKGISPTAARRAQISEQTRGAGNGNATLHEDGVREIKRLLAARVQVKEVALRTGMSVNTISRIKNGRSWAHVTLDDPGQEPLIA